MFYSKVKEQFHSLRPTILLLGHNHVETLPAKTAKMLVKLQVHKTICLTVCCTRSMHSEEGTGKEKHVSLPRLEGL